MCDSDLILRHLLLLGLLAVSYDALMYHALDVGAPTDDSVQLSEGY